VGGYGDVQGQRGDGKVFGAGQAAAEGDEAGLLEVLGCLLELAGLAEGGFLGEVVCSTELGYNLGKLR
jgi:hypothetical protein